MPHESNSMLKDAQVKYRQRHHWNFPSPVNSLLLTNQVKTDRTASYEQHAGIIQREPAEIPP